MQKIGQYFEKLFFYKQVLDFHIPFKILCHTSKSWNFVKILALVILRPQHWEKGIPGTIEYEEKTRDYRGNCERQVLYSGDFEQWKGRGEGGAENEKERINWCRWREG